MPIRDISFISLYNGQPPNPWLPINVINPTTGQNYYTYGLIDTGAYSCVIPGSIAQIIGYDINSGSLVQGSGVGGAFEAWEHSMEIDIKDQNGIVLHKITGKINVVIDLQIVLLGVALFLNDFHLQVHYPNQKFSITYP